MFIDGLGPEPNDVTKVSSFAIPAAPQQPQLQPQQQLLSAITVDTLKANEKNDNYTSSLQEETLIFNELLLKRVNQKIVKKENVDAGPNVQKIQR